MSETGGTANLEFVLPQNVVSKGDVARLVIELERIDNELTAAAVREKTGAATDERPVLSDRLVAFLEKNSLNIDNSHNRSELIGRLRHFKDKVPVLHMIFAVEVDTDSLHELVGWLRSSIHPQTVIEVGLQPALVAGVYLRTPNKVHDFSLRGLLAAKHDNLTRELETLRGN